MPQPRWHLNTAFISAVLSMANHQGLITCKLTAISPSCIRLCATWWNATRESNLKRGTHTCRKCGRHCVSLIAVKDVKAVKKNCLCNVTSIRTSYYLRVTLFSLSKAFYLSLSLTHTHALSLLTYVLVPGVFFFWRRRQICHRMVGFRQRPGLSHCFYITVL